MMQTTREDDQQVEKLTCLPPNTCRFESPEGCFDLKMASLLQALNVHRGWWSSSEAGTSDSAASRENSEAKTGDQARSSDDSTKTESSTKQAQAWPAAG